MSNQRQGGFIGAAIGLTVGTILFLALLLWPVFYVYSTQQDRTINVTKTERIVTSGGSESKYLVFAKEGVFENTDSILRWKFDSADVHNSILPEQKYNCDTYGWRVPFLSMYPNIVSGERIEDER